LAVTYQERQEIIDQEHLRILRIAYLVSGGTNALWAFFPLIHITLGLMMMFGGFAGEEGEAVPAGAIFVIIGTLFSLFRTGRHWGRRRSWCCRGFR